MVEEYRSVHDTEAVDATHPGAGIHRVVIGGTKASGTGRELGSTGMDQFANLKVYAYA